MRARLLLVVALLALLPAAAGAQAPVNVAELAARFMQCALGPDGQLIATVDRAEIRSVSPRPGSLGVAETLYTWRKGPLPAEGSNPDRPIAYRELGGGEAVIMTFHTENGALVNRVASICWQVAWDTNYSADAER